jgi:hypothetical protein
MTNRRKAIFFILLAAIAFSIAGIATFGKSLLEYRLRQALIAQGFEGVTFSIGGLGFTGIVFKDISLGEKVPLTLDSLTVDYSILELLNRQVRDLRVDHLIFKKNTMKTEVKNIALHFDPDEHNAWQGEWGVESVEISGTPVLLPMLSGAGTFIVQSGTAKGKGEFQSADHTHKAAFEAMYNPDNAASNITITNASMPWNGGTLSTRGAIIPLAGAKSVTLALKVVDVPLDTLLQAATGKRASATGEVSGVIPVTIGKDNTFIFHDGNLKAQEAGIIKLAANAIPTDNEQVGVLRDVLSDFHYQELTVAMDSDKDEKLSMLLQLRGNNPEVYNGREVKLNVKLTGDVLNLMQQTVIPLANPEKFLEEKS